MIIAGSVGAAVVLIACAACFPVAHEEAHAATGELGLLQRRAIAPQSLPHQVINRPPNVALPVFLRCVFGIVIRQSRDQPGSPEFPGIGESLQNALCPLRIGGATDEWIEVHRRNTSQESPRLAVFTP